MFPWWATLTLHTLPATPVPLLSPFDDAHPSAVPVTPPGCVPRAGGGVTTPKTENVEGRGVPTSLEPNGLGPRSGARVGTNVTILGSHRGMGHILAYHRGLGTISHAFCKTCSVLRVLHWFLVALWHPFLLALRQAAHSIETRHNNLLFEMRFEVIIPFWAIHYSDSYNTTLVRMM